MLTERKVVALSPRPYALSSSYAGTARASATVYNLSERQHTHNAPDWLAMIVESSNDAIISTSLDGIILSWNQAAQRLFGYLSVMVIGHPVAILFPTEGVAEMQELIARCGQGEHINGHEMEYVRENGHHGCVSLAFSPIRNTTDAIVGVAMIARDITQRKRAEERQHSDKPVAKKGRVLHLVASSI